ncbi:phosphopentomutase [Metabacillus indicus]|uniref:phosphopentomutase n=1 Tax=Metabacillus indicus TaxID=246786 RepID=UPI002A0591A8|nr:phosphopentomutase [Metabacillus indicus]MDX8291452.1 phosphopentomutase [Metabacillus indicus]
MGRVSLFILDGFGVGAMKDCANVKPEDIYANTYLHLKESTDLNIPFLSKMGLNRLTHGEGRPMAAYGKSNLAHAGADTFMGHQELMGSKPAVPQKRFMKEVARDIKFSLIEMGFLVEHPFSDSPILLVNGSIVIGDNLESSPGNIINLICDLNQIQFEKACEVARAVRKCVDTSRVIVFGNKKTSVKKILAAARKLPTGQFGIDSPNAEVYGEGYQVMHLGYGVDYSRQFAHIAEMEGYPVYRIGKTADVIQAKGFSNPAVETASVLKSFLESYSNAEDNAIFLVNVQETDLAGHKQDSDWYRSVLEESDAFLEEFCSLLENDDLLIVTADHGNDPTIGHSNHTREQTPIFVMGNNVKPVSIGERETMADIAATMAEYMNLPSPEYGKSFLKEILITI